MKLADFLLNCIVVKLHFQTAFLLSAICFSCFDAEHENVVVVDANLLIPHIIVLLA